MLRKGGTTRNGIQMNVKRVQDQVFITPRLTYRFQGRDFRLTDVSGEVVRKLLV